MLVYCAQYFCNYPMSSYVCWMIWSDWHEVCQLVRLAAPRRVGLSKGYTYIKLHFHASIGELVFHF